ncbi:MAG: hypothetical protein JWM11_5073 [Planctomycetaceae bacterium]|nr:hypothetical protein [Planctomycetaceae bacterium]
MTRLSDEQSIPAKKVSFTAKAQLSLVEHALCPLDSDRSLQPGFCFETQYLFTDPNRNRKTAKVRIGTLDGLSAHDEFYLWGLLSLAVSQPEASADFYATPYYCLRRLGVITAEKKGGREFELFRAALKRLAGVRYQNDHFYDPVRGEHRSVSFGFLNYSLPLDLNSNRAWRFAWDPIFFELVEAAGGALAFDLHRYKEFDVATRRLYLFLKKLFWRQDVTSDLDLRHIAVHVLGFNETLETARLKWNVRHCIDELLAAELILLLPGTASSKDVFSKKAKGHYTFQLHRGPAFEQPLPATSFAAQDSALFDPLKQIGFDERAITHILKTYSPRLIEQWADITLAARERQGEKFFTKSPQAYFTDNLKAAAADRRTPPDWWRELRKRERELEREQEQSKSQLLSTKGTSFEDYLKHEAREAFEKTMQQLLSDLERSGKSAGEARSHAQELTRAHFWNQFRKEHPEVGNTDRPQLLGSFFKQPR